MILKTKDFKFKCQSFNETIAKSGGDDILYCDPPYINRHSDYYGGWDKNQETTLHQALSETTSKFILSTWHHNEHRQNKYIKTWRKNYQILTREHYYYVGGKEKNRNPMVEALVTNYDMSAHQRKEVKKQLVLLEGSPSYCALL